MEIRDLPERVRLTQLAEEATELAHSALKLARVIEGINPTPVNEAEAREKMLEEFADVMVCLEELIAPDDEMKIAVKMLEKVKRWEQRMEAMR